MERNRLAALMIAVLIIGLGVGRTATASHQTSHKAYSGGAEFKGLVAKTQSSHLGVTSNLPTFGVVDSRTFEIPAGDTQLIGVDFFGETFCTGTGDCKVRAEIGRTRAAALDGTPGSVNLDSAASEGTESHAMGWALCVRNATSAPLDVTVFLTAAKSSGASFTLVKYTLRIARNSPCSPSVNI